MLPVISEPAATTSDASNAWLYAMIAVTVVCIVPLIGGVLFFVPSDWRDVMVGPHAADPVAAI